MKITVLGAGVTGIAFAWFLRQAGRAVLGRAAADHTVQCALHRRVNHPQPVPQHGARHARLDPRLRIGAAIADIISGRVPEVDFAFTGQLRERQPMSMGKPAAAPT